MTRKKSSQWLNKIKRRKNEENRWSCDWSTKIFQTPQKFRCVHVLTPIRLTRGSPSSLKRTPNRQRIYSSIIVHYDSEYTYIITKNSSSQISKSKLLHCKIAGIQMQYEELCESHMRSIFSSPTPPCVTTTI